MAASVGDHDGAWHLPLIKLGEQEASAHPWEAPVTSPCCKAGLACQAGDMLSSFPIPGFHISSSSRDFQGANVGQAGGSACCSPAAHLLCQELQLCHCLADSEQALKLACDWSEVSASGGSQGRDSKLQTCCYHKLCGFEGHTTPLSLGFLTGKELIVISGRRRQPSG